VLVVCGLVLRRYVGNGLTVCALMWWFGGEWVGGVWVGVAAVRWQWVDSVCVGGVGWEVCLWVRGGEGDFRP